MIVCPWTKNGSTPKKPSHISFNNIFIPITRKLKFIQKWKLGFRKSTMDKHLQPNQIWGVRTCKRSEYSPLSENFGLGFARGKTCVKHADHRSAAAAASPKTSATDERLLHAMFHTSNDHMAACGAGAGASN